MIGRLNHVAIAVRDLNKATAIYRDVLGADVSAATPQPAHGVTTVFVELPNTKIELLEPLGGDSPIARFLERNPEGGIHHICYEVDDIRATREALKTVTDFADRVAAVNSCQDEAGGAEGSRGGAIVHLGPDRETRSRQRRRGVQRRRHNDAH